jgi:hypothetical protein
MRETTSIGCPSRRGWTPAAHLPAKPSKGPRFGCVSWEEYPGDGTRRRDAVRQEGDTVLFFHRNRDDALLFDFIVRQQGLEKVKDQLVNTQKGRTFGGNMQAAEGTTDDHGLARMTVAGSSQRGISPGFYRVEISKAGEAIRSKYNTETCLGQEVASDAAGLNNGIAPVNLHY